MSEPAQAVDPRKIAVALEYDFKGAPRVTAKGRGYVAEEILRTARAHDVPVQENGALAGALTNVEMDQEIPEALYRAVAEILGFVLRVKANRENTSG
jgi:flagellar biosynthesis protein